jgi:hypothetical protein
MSAELETTLILTGECSWCSKRTQLVRAEIKGKGANLMLPHLMFDLPGQTKMCRGGEKPPRRHSRARMVVLKVRP